MDVKPFILFLLAFATFPISTDAECEYSNLGINFLRHTVRDSTEKECKEMCEGFIFCLIWQWQPNKKICWLIRAQIKFELSSTIGINNCKDRKPSENAPVCEVKKGDKQLRTKRYNGISKADCKNECMGNCIMWQHTKQWCKIYKFTVDEKKNSLVGIHYCNSSPTSSVTTCVPCGVAENNQKSKNQTSKIVGGIEAKPHAYPFQVYIETTRFEVIKGVPTQVFFRCGGTIISRRSILTAAHCTQNFTPAQILVFVGQHNLDAVNYPGHAVETKVEHTDFDRFGNMANDVAVLTLRDMISYDNTASPVCLPKIDRNWFGYEYENKPHRVIGWGKTGTHLNVSQVLLETDITTMRNVDCYNQYKRYYMKMNPFPTWDQICAIGPKKDSCKGDSGGPLLYRENNHWIQTGIVSFGPTIQNTAFCNDQDYPDAPGVYSRTTTNIEFIKRNMIPDCNNNLGG